jgi:hypothetical protein
MHLSTDEYCRVKTNGNDCLCAHLFNRDKKTRIARRKENAFLLSCPYYCHVVSWYLYKEVTFTSIQYNQKGIQCTGLSGPFLSLFFFTIRKKTTILTTPDREKARTTLTMYMGQNE